MSVCKYQTLSIIVFGISAIIILVLIFQPYMWQDEFLGKWASVVTILSLVGVPIVYFRKQDQKEQEITEKESSERKRASKNLYGELQDALDSLDRIKYSDTACSFEITEKNGKKEIFFMNRDFNHDFYDSLIFSGKINFLRHELQQEIQDVFKRLKTHNNFLELVLKMQDDEKDNTIPEKTWKYYKWMDESEVKLLKEIPDILEKLKKDFDI